MPDLTFLSAVGFTALGLVAGVRLGCWWAWLLSSPLPRPWRPLARAWRYLAPGALWRDVGRAMWTGRWT